MARRLAESIESVGRAPKFLKAASQSLLRDEYRRLLQSARYENQLRLHRFGYSLYSQSDEDGIIEEIFRRIGETNRVFVEFGCGDGLENNSHSLLLKGWKGLWIDGSDDLTRAIKKKFKDVIDEGSLAVENSFVTPENINGLIETHFRGEIDLLSVDIDGNDFHVLWAVDCINPRAVVVEYNARKGPAIDWVMDYNPKHRWDGSDYFGASLKAFEHLMREKGFLLVGCSISGVNAFFVRQDLVDDKLFLSPFVSEVHFEPAREFLRLGMHTAHPRNYGPWISAENLLERT